jgi:phosphomannomutase
MRVSTIPPDLHARTRAWIDGDPDDATRAELEALLEHGDVDELSERMAGSLVFGTAGIRGVVEGGSNRMNRAVVIRTTRGLADYLLDRDPESDRPVVVGADARLSSAQFLQDTVGVLAAAGIPVRYFSDPTPTPVVAYAANMLAARAAVVVTASHNPPADNGYKVYDVNGAQIVPPVDKDIAAAIARVGPAIEVPRIRNAVDDSDLVQPVPVETFRRYLEDLQATRIETPGVGASLSFVVTPIHGVGGKFVVEALNTAGYPNVHPVPEQSVPDGHFPTVSFPNPEEPGALDLALALAAETDADAILANDPDTDRLAVALPHGGEWKALTGNQIGVLLGDFILEHTKVGEPLVGNSIVSSPMLGDIAASYGARFVQTLTGFKWIWNAALDIQDEGAATFVFGYEEALGYSVGQAVRDKDGISAAVTFADLVAAESVRGRTAWDRLEDLYRRHGLWVSTQRSVVRPGTEGAAAIKAAMERIGSTTPDTLGGHRVVGTKDYRVGAEQRPRYLAAASLVELDLGPGGRVLVRPSGTEPKIKIYADLRSNLTAGDDVWERESALLEDAGSIAEELVEFLGI